MKNRQKSIFLSVTIPVMRAFRSAIVGLPRVALGLVLAATLGAMLPASSHALSFNQNVTPDVIFGSGNANGFFTVDQRNGVELGLRAKIPFVGTLNSNGDGTYSYTLAETDQFAPGDPRWNFDWTVNTDWDNSSGLNIDDLTYLLGIDFDPSQGTNFLAFDPITPNVAPLNAPFFDHSIGTNITVNGGGVEAGDAVTYATLIANNNVLQQSWRHSFFPVHPTLTYDPTIDGTYDIFLTAFNSAGEQVASTNIQVIIGAGGEPIEVALDIKPQSCPNPLNVKSKGLLPVAILGTDDFDVSSIDITTLKLNGEAPVKNSFEDVTAPTALPAPCDCEELVPDTYQDLTLKFDRQAIIATLGAVENGDEILLTLTGELTDGTPIEGSDCVVIKGVK